jgi:N-succinyldiaminopimelate aminotransferase
MNPAAPHTSSTAGTYGENPGTGYVRIALVPPMTDCVEAARRIVEFCH